jgi:hypothetical protein
LGIFGLSGNTGVYLAFILAVYFVSALNYKLNRNSTMGTTLEAFEESTKRRRSQSADKLGNDLLLATTDESNGATSRGNV